jgi:hypothetical protein
MPLRQANPSWLLRTSTVSDRKPAQLTAHNPLTGESSARERAWQVQRFIMRLVILMVTYSNVFAADLRVLPDVSISADPNEIPSRR